MQPRYSYVRQFAPAFLAAFNFSSNRQPDVLLEAINIIRNLDTQGKRKVPENASVVFVPKKWSEYVTAQEGKRVRKYYELCALWELRIALHSGNIWLTNSRRYANPESYLIPTIYSLAQSKLKKFWLDGMICYGWLVRLS